MNDDRELRQANCELFELVNNLFDGILYAATKLKTRAQVIAFLRGAPLIEQQFADKKIDFIKVGDQEGVYIMIDAQKINPEWVNLESFMGAILENEDGTFTYERV